MIKIANELISDLLLLEHESCGFLYGIHTFYGRHEVANTAVKKDMYKMKKIDVMKFILKYLTSKSRVYCIYHVHKDYGYISQGDKKTMIRDIPYLIIYNGQLYFYQKEGESVKRLEYEVV